MLRCLCAGVALGLTACSAPPVVEPKTPEPSPPVPRSEPASATVPVPYDVDEEGRYPSPPVVPAEPARGWRDTLVVGPSVTRDAAPGDTAGREAPRTVLGYRVQIAACGSEDLARALQERIHRETPWRAYVVHEPPYYKVRVGDCADEPECRRLESRLRADGWESAWVVRTRLETR